MFSTVFNLFFIRATVEALPHFVWESFSQISLYSNIPHTQWEFSAPHQHQDGSERFNITIQAFYFESIGRNLFLNHRKQDGPQQRPSFTAYSQKSLNSVSGVKLCMSHISNCTPVLSLNVPDTIRHIPSQTSFTCNGTSLKPELGKQVPTSFFAAPEKDYPEKTHYTQSLYSEVRA